MNLAVDMLLGAIPAVGDVFDFVFKANVKNAELLCERAPGRSTPRDWFIVVGAGALFMTCLAVPILTLVWFFGKLTG